MYKPTGMDNSSLVDQEDPLSESMRSDYKADDIYVGKGHNKLSVKDIRKKIEELSKHIDLSDITKPDCENTVINTRGICIGYIVFVLVSLIGLVGIFIWKYCRGWIKNNKKSKTNNDIKEEA